MDEAKEGAPLAKEALSRLTIPRETREEALDCLEAPLLWRELRARREREHGLELRRPSLSTEARSEASSERERGDGMAEAQEKGEKRRERSSSSASSSSSRSETERGAGEARRFSSSRA
jgi:hypothetical protein